LGIEYIKALKKIKSKIIPFAIKRQGADYHDNSVPTATNMPRFFPPNVDVTYPFASATALRKQLSENSYNTIAEYVPPFTYKLLMQSVHSTMPIVVDDFSLLLKHKLLKESNISLQKYLDVTENIANRIINNRNNFTTFSDFIALIKTKEVTYTRISRVLIHLLLDIKKESLELATRPSYIRVLGFKSESSDLLTAITNNSFVPLITRLGQTSMLDDYAEYKLEQNIYISDLYQSVCSDKFGVPFINEYSRKLLVI
jgi:predicted nucleotidyltransferase